MDQDTFFADRQISFYENGQCLYTVSLKDLGYSLDTKALKKGTVFKRRQDLEIPFKIVRDDNKFSETLSKEHF